MNRLKQLWSDFRVRLTITMTGLFLLLAVWETHTTNERWISGLTLIAVVYAYAQLTLSWITYSDSTETNRLLEEIRDLLKGQR